MVFQKHMIQILIQVYKKYTSSEIYLFWFNFMDYIVLDLETANSNYASICQLGMVEIHNGTIKKTHDWLIDPEDYFDSFNVSLHGITEECVNGSPSFEDIYNSLKNKLSDTIIVHHGHFDRVAINQACDYHGLATINARWLNNVTVVRRAWKQFRRSTKLNDLCRHFDISLNHHDALEDAKATAEIFSLAVEKTGLSPGEWIERVKRPIDWD